MQIARDSLWRGRNVLELLLRIGVLFSLFLQIVLTIYGNRRRYWRKNWVLTLLLWIAYQSATLLVTVSLGILFRKDATDESLVTNYAMTALWAPILLVHLGGADTITGYSVEDNELWIRHCLGMITPFGVACYVIWKSWNTSSLKFIAIPVFVAALVKCGERIWALLSASREHFRGSVICDPDPGPNYAKFMDEYCSKTSEGYEVSVISIVPNEASAVLSSWPFPQQLREELTHNIQDAQIVHDAQYVFKVFKPLFADLMLSFQDQDSSLDYFTRKLWDQACKVPSLQDDDSRKLYQVRTAFRIIEVELGFMYDLLHTKTTLFYSYWPWSTFFRIVSILSTVSAFIAFYIIDKRKYFRIEVLVTYVLLAVAIPLELYAVIVLLSSDWAMLWTCRLKRMGLQIYKFISSMRWLHLVPANKRWSNSMSQLNLISICVRENPALLPSLQKKVHIHELLEMLRYEYQADVSDSLKLLIYDRLKEEATSDSGKKQVWAHRGDQTLEDMNIRKKVSFYQCILLWHIATTLCYYDPDNDRNNMVFSESERVMSMKLSNYMMYLFITSPFMLPNGNRHITYQDTRAEASRFLEERKKSIKESTETACKMLLAVNTSIEPSEVKGDRSNSVVFDAGSLNLCATQKQKHINGTLLAKHGWRCWHMLRVGVLGTTMPGSSQREESCSLMSGF